MRSFLLFLLVYFFFFPATSIAQENQGYVETVAWWNGVVLELQPYREQLQNLYAETEAGLSSNRNQIETEFRKRLVRDYPGSSYYASMGGVWQVNGYTAFGYDRGWHIHKLTQRFGTLTKSYDFRQNVFTVGEGQNSIGLKLDLNRPQRSGFSHAVIPAIAVTAEQLWLKRSSRTTHPGPIAYILNDVYAERFAGTEGMRMDKLAEKMVAEAETRQQVLALAGEMYADSTWQPASSHQPTRNNPLQIFQPGAQWQFPFNLFDLIPGYFWFILAGLLGLKIFISTRGTFKILGWILSRPWPKPQEDRTGNFSLGGKRAQAYSPTWNRTPVPVAEEWSISGETAVPREWSLPVLQSLEWKRFETVCAEYLRLIGLDPRETKIGADGGVDIWVYKPGRETPVFIVQCKAWKAYKVGVKPVRELLGVMTKEKVINGKFITSGEYTAEAVAFVEGEKLKLVTGKMLIDSILKLPAAKQKELLDIAVEGDYRTPTCPQCGVKMTLRQGQGRDFWGCPKYPRCKQKLFYKSDVA